MPLPKWIQQTRSGSIVLPPVVAALAAGPPAYQLLFNMQPQQQNNWCWAAVSVSVALLQAALPAWQQCQVVSQELGNATCCTNGSSAVCDVPWYLDRALTRVGHLKTWSAGS